MRKRASPDFRSPEVGISANVQLYRVGGVEISNRHLSQVSCYLGFLCSIDFKTPVVIGVE